jgi:hypothetical protein
MVRVGVAYRGRFDSDRGVCIAEGGVDLGPRAGTTMYGGVVLMPAYFGAEMKQPRPSGPGH